MSLTTATDSPELTVTIGSASYSFSELPIAALAKLQAWIRSHVPHPLDALKGHLDGLDPADRAVLLEAARVEARSWPPEIGTAAGAAALLGSEPGQVEALAAGLSVHHPELTRPDVERLYRALGKETMRLVRAARSRGRAYDGEGTMRRVFATLFGLDDGGGGDDDEVGLPNSDARPVPSEASTGT